MTALNPTPGQTAGPFFGYALPYPGGPELVPPGRADAIRVTGQVLDGAGQPVPDALLELWQAGPDGEVPQVSGSFRRDGWTFTGWGRAATDADGRYTFSTLRPGPTATGGAPFFALALFARGLLDRLLTRIYLPEDTAAHELDPLLSSLPLERRSTLIAAAGPGGYRFDIVLQGAAQTVFLQHTATARP